MLLPKPKMKENNFYFPKIFLPQLSRIALQKFQKRIKKINQFNKIERKYILNQFIKFKKYLFQFI
jgi:hypothetical protein